MRFAASASLHVIVLGTIFSFGCTRYGDKPKDPESEQPRLVVLYAPCSVAKRFLSPYNDEISYTPNLEAFAKNSTVFEKHRTEAGLSGIAYASILTGNQAQDHGVFSHPTYLADSIYDITEAFADNGYDVYFWNSQRMGAADLNYGQGVSPNRVFQRVLTGDDNDFKAILRRLGRDKSKRAFLLVNHAENHTPYRTDYLDKFKRDYPEEAKLLDGISTGQFHWFVNMYYEHQHTMKYAFEQFREEQNLTDVKLEKLVRVVEFLYKSNIPVLDRLFGEVVTAIDDAGLGNDSLIAFTADHGESLYRSHAPFKWSHGHAVQSDVLDVPLIIRAPSGHRTPGRSGVVTRSVDLFPTLASLARLELPSGTTVEGYDLSKFMQPGHIDPDLIAFSHSGMVYPTFREPKGVQKLMGKFLARYYPAADMDYTWVAARRGDIVWKYRPVEDANPVFQAFDLAVDPTETTNIFNADDPIHQEMSEQLKQYKKDLVRSFREWGSARAQGLLDEDEQMERLRSMGYIK